MGEAQVPFVNHQTVHIHVPVKIHWSAGDPDLLFNTIHLLSKLNVKMIKQQQRQKITDQKIDRKNFKKRKNTENLLSYFE